MRQFALSMIAYTTASILGPLLVFGGAGYYFGTYLKGGRVYVFIGIGIAFIVTNILQFFKVRALLKKINGKAAETNESAREEHNNQEKP